MFPLQVCNYEINYKLCVDKTATNIQNIRSLN